MKIVDVKSLANEINANSWRECINYLSHEQLELTERCESDVGCAICNLPSNNLITSIKRPYFKTALLVLDSKDAIKLRCRNCFWYGFMMSSSRIGEFILSL